MYNKVEIILDYRKGEHNMNYQLYTKVNDGGQVVSKIIVECDGNVEGSSISLSQFDISVKRSLNGTELDYAKRRVKSVYTSATPNGHPSLSGKYLHLVLLTKNNTKSAGTLTYDIVDMVTKRVDLDYTVELKEPISTVDGNIVVPHVLEYTGTINAGVDEFEKYQSTSGLLYREYAPTFDGNKKALIVWLHGMGEGGKDNDLPITGNRGGTAFISKEVQRIFGGAYVVAPQCPTFWMPFEYKGVFTENNYTKELLALIDEVCVFHPDIDENRIYIGGCSMGGYQTLKTVLAAPHRFAAAFPICPAYELSQKEANRIKHVPMFFTHCMTDTTVPSSNSVRNYERLNKAGSDCEITLYSDIRCKGETYHAHAAWVPALNNEPTSRDGEHLFEWVAKHTRTQVPSKKKWILPAIIGGAIICGAAAAILLHELKED